MVAITSVHVLLLSIQSYGHTQWQGRLGNSPWQSPSKPVLLESQYPCACKAPPSLHIQHKDRHRLSHRKQRDCSHILVAYKQGVWLCRCTPNRYCWCRNRTTTIKSPIQKKNHGKHSSPWSTPVTLLLRNFRDTCSPKVLVPMSPLEGPFGCHPPWPLTFPPEKSILVFVLLSHT